MFQRGIGIILSYIAIRLTVVFRNSSEIVFEQSTEIICGKNIEMALKFQGDWRLYSVLYPFYPEAWLEGASRLVSIMKDVRARIVRQVQHQQHTYSAHTCST